jgi:predicted dehydrogenase
LATSKTRVGFVGAGIIANRHVGNLLAFEDVQVAAVADLVPDRATTLAARAGCPAYADLDHMLDRESLDAVYICVPPYAHGAPEQAVIARGLPFFVEKPLAVDLATAEDIAQRVRGTDLVTGTGYHWRYLDITEQARELLASKPAHLALGYWLDFTPPPEWWVVEARSGGQLVEQTTHIFDLARLLVGDVTRVYAAGRRLSRPAFPQADIDVVSTATLHFASGALGSMSSTAVLNWPHRIGLHLFCEGMAIELSEFELMVDVGQGRPIQRATGDPFVREDRDFIDAVQGKPNRVRAPYAEALETHRLATTVARSAREGRPIDVAPMPVSVASVDRDENGSRGMDILLPT